MIIVCKAFEERLDRVWYKLQCAVQAKYQNSISQVDLDDECVTTIEQLVEKLQREQDNHRRVGSLVDGAFQCLDCCHTSEEHCPVFRINIGFYSQQCSKCKKLVVDGCKSSAQHNLPLNLFDKGLWNDSERREEEALAARQTAVQEGAHLDPKKDFDELADSHNH